MVMSTDGNCTSGWHHRDEPATAQTVGAISEGCVIANIGFWLYDRISQTFYKIPVEPIYKRPLGLYVDCRVLDNDFPRNNTDLSPMKSKSCIMRWNTSRWVVRERFRVIQSKILKVNLWARIFKNSILF